MAELLAVRHNYSGFQISGSLLRNYNYSKEMSHVLGTVGYVDESDIEIYKGDKYQNAKFVGKTGLEKFYNDFLSFPPNYLLGVEWVAKEALSKNSSPNILRVF